MNEPTETDREWNEGISPECKVFDEVVAVERNDADQAMFDELAAYARKHGGSDASIAWGRLRARNALRDGRSPSYAYDVGRQAIDDVLGSVERAANPWPITTVYNVAREIGLLDIHCTATGVAGRYQDFDDDGHSRWFRVRVDAVGSEPQMRLGE